MVRQEVANQHQYREDVVHGAQDVHQGVVQIRLSYIWLRTKMGLKIYTLLKVAGFVQIRSFSTYSLHS